MIDYINMWLTLAIIFTHYVKKLLHELNFSNN